MPYMSYHISKEETIKNAGRFIQEGKADAVKIEGGRKRKETIEALLDAEIPVMGHLGLTPQSVNVMGGFKIQANWEQEKNQIIINALPYQASGSKILEQIADQMQKKKLPMVVDLRDEGDCSISQKFRLSIFKP